MKKISLFLCLSILFALTGCYKDDINDLKRQVNDLNDKQTKLEQLVESYRTLLEAIQNKVTVESINRNGGSYNIVFSNGTVMNVTNGCTAMVTVEADGNWYIDGQNTKIAAGEEAPAITIGANKNWFINGTDTGIAGEETVLETPYIVSVTDMNGMLVFRLSDGSEITVHKAKTAALWILSEGSWGKGDSNMAFYDIATQTVTAKYYPTLNGGNALGETANDLKAYGSKMYCAVSGTDLATGNGYVEVMGLDGVAKKRIVIEQEDGSPDMPRKLTTGNGKVYVSLYSGAVAAIDTASLEVADYGKLSGAFSEGLCYYKNKVYVCNSGAQGDSFAGSGNTISVVDAATLTEEKTITVATNPKLIAVSADGQMFFNTLGDYAATPANLHLLDPEAGTVTRSFGVPTSNFAVGKDYVYTVSFSYTDYETTIKKIGLESLTAEDFTADIPSYMFGNSVSVDPANGDVYIGQTMGDTVYAFSADGTQKYKVKTKVQNISSVVAVTR